MSRVSQRRAIRRFRESSDLKGIALCCLDLSLFAAAIVGVVLLSNGFAKVLASLLVGLQIARLFVLGHDACHQSLFANRNANRWIGRVLFLPSLTPYSTWEVGHNLGHHAYTNLRGMDYVWAPLSKAEFDAASPLRQRLERFYRSGFGFGLYYLVELWWHKLFFVSRKHISTRRAAFVADSVLALAFAFAWLGGLVAAARVTQQSPALLVLLGFVVPFLLWGWLMGAVIYFHHTHPRLVWFQDIDRWEASRDESSNTVHVQLPFKLGRVLNNIMEHPAHHLDVRIPLYQLEAANRHLGAAPPIVAPFTPKSIVDCIVRCKLYDYTTGHWTDFDGNRTSPTSAATAGALS